MLENTDIQFTWQFTWDEKKREQNIEKHKLDFIICGDLFDGRAMISKPSPRETEVRFLSVTEWNGMIVTVIWTWRGELRRIISLRRARDDEKQAYENILSE